MILTDKCTARKILNEFSRKGLLKDSEMTDELFQARTLDDFVMNCIAVNQIQYVDFPVDYKENINFLTSLANLVPQLVEEIHAENEALFRIVVYRMKDVSELTNSKLISGRTKKEIRKIVRLRKNNENSKSDCVEHEEALKLNNIQNLT